jgi:hypothetical protein
MDNNKLNKVKEELEKARSFLTQRLPLELRKEFEQKAFIGGGAIYSLYNGSEPNDYDFFLTDKDLVNRLREAIIKHLNDFSNPESLYINEKENMIHGSVFGHRYLITDNAISVDGKYQIITRWVGEPEEVISEFDFKHNMYCYRNKELHTYSQWDYLEDNKLRYNEKRARDICGTIIRVKKFVERGHTITNREMSKMLLKLHEVGFNERELEILERAGGFGS